MTTSGVKELCDGLSWRLQMSQEPGYSSKYTLGDALGDLTVVGTLYNAGGDFARLNRANRSIEWLNGFAQADKPQQENASFLIDGSRNLFAREKNTNEKSILSKIGYLASLSMALIGHSYSNEALRNTGLVGSVVMGAYFMFKAGVDTQDRSFGESVGFLQQVRNDLEQQSVRTWGNR